MDQRMRRRKARTDWFRVLVDIRKAGSYDARLAREIGVCKSAICAWKQGAQPRAENQQKLIGMWEMATGRHANEAPTLW